MNQYNPKIHHRRSRRLKEYDYSKSGLYFITLLCENRIHRFGQIKNGKMKLNEYGQIAFDEWIKLAKRFSKFKMNVFQIMPDHLHGIIELVGSNKVASLAVAPIGMCLGRWYKNDSSARATLVQGQPSRLPPTNKCEIDSSAKATLAVAQNQNKSIADIVSAYKSLVFNACLVCYKSKNKIMGRLWHRNYYERVIRNKLAYTRISNYIINNPSKWTEKKG
jgi:REP element-mobilizing transposase RayT